MTLNGHLSSAHPQNGATMSSRSRALFGHRDSKTAMIYTHVINRGQSGVRSTVGKLEAVFYSFCKTGASPQRSAADG